MPHPSTVVFLVAACAFMVLALLFYAQDPYEE